MPQRNQPHKKKPKTKRGRSPPVVTPVAAVPIPPATVAVPTPVLSKLEKRFFSVVQTKNLIGGAMFFAGIGILIGWFFSDKVHGVEKFAIVASVVLMIFGAHMLSSEPTERALKAIGGTAARLIPFAKRQTEEQQTAKPGD